MAKKKSTHFKRDLRKEVINIFQRQPNKPLNHKQVSSELGITDAGIRTLIFEMLQQEVIHGTLKEIERGKFLLKKPSQETVEGIIHITRHGRGFVTLPDMEEDLEVAKGETGLALNGDTVEVVYNPRARRPEVRVVRVTARTKTQFVGIIQLSKDHAFFIPSDARIHVDFYIPKEHFNGAKNGDKVVAEITEWSNPDKSPFAKIIHVLGKPGSHNVEMHAIIAEFGLPLEFPEEVIRETNTISEAIPNEEIKKRRDFRAITTFTIDPYDAKDFDDALSYQKLPNGNIEVGVHIADVSHYMKPGTLLDMEGYQRATSVYLVDRTIPMLPEKLSNELCSLRPHEDKLCFSAVFELTPEAEIRNAWFGRTIIYSDRRFTYEEAQQIIETGKGDYSDEIIHLDQLAKKLRAERFRHGAIDFDTEEVKFKLDDMGKPIGVTIKRMKDSNQLIEEFMLLANRKVGEFIGKKKAAEPDKTFIYRIHDEPDVTRLQQLRNFLKNLGYKLPKAATRSSVSMVRSILDLAEGQPEEDIVKTMAIRSMAKAEYSTQNIGHYGLAFDYYTHFTSPIRRYPDVMAHRLLQHYLDGGSSANGAEYELKCKHSSAMEKRAAEAERASIKYKQVEYMMDNIGKIFDGVISGLSSWGFYVEVGETKSEGMITLKSLTWDHFEFDADHYIIRGRKSGGSFQLGDKVMIKVLGGDLNRRTLDYELMG